MNTVSIIMAVFALIGAVDRIFGNKLGLGKEFEKGFLLLGTLSLSMIGMIIISPFLAQLLTPFSDFVYNVFKIDPSIIPATLFANDMGGAPLAKEMSQNSDVGMFNAMVVSSMMGATISFTVPYALGVLKKEKHKDLLLGLLCGIVTIPIGSFLAGLICKIPVGVLLLNILPLIIFALLVATGLLLIPSICIKIFNILGTVIKIIITIGLALGILKFLTGAELIKGLTSIEEGAIICLNAAIVMSGAFPLLKLISKVLSKPIKVLGKALKINEKSTLGFVSTLATNTTTFEMMNEMDSKGSVLNSAFAVSASFALADHLAFTLAFAPSYLFPMITAKIVSGIFAVIFASVIYNKHKAE